MRSNRKISIHPIVLSLAFASTQVAAITTLTTDAPSNKIRLNASQALSITATASGASCTASSPTYVITAAPRHGTVTQGGSFISSGSFTYTNNDSGNGTLAAASETLTISATCGSDVATTNLKFSSAASFCGGADSGMVIFDNTATPHLASIKSNLKFYAGCDKDQSTIESGFGGNSISIEDFHVLQRNIATDPDQLILSIGVQQNKVEDYLINTPDQVDLFSAGKHLFELNPLPSTADWLSGTTASTSNITPDVGVATGAYGSMTLKQFVQHIADGDTLYGVVRVRIGLQKGQRADCGGSCGLNALRQTVADASIYGFCDDTATAGLCAATACAPGKDFDEIAPNSTVCGIALKNDAKIRVKGSLFFDFVDYNPASGASEIIPLAALPFAPKELYFKVSVPIMVNWAHDANLDGAMDNMLKVRGVSNGQAGGVLTPSINFSDIPQESRAAYLYQTGTALTAALFTALSNADKYHLLMPSGYAAGWADAFNKLNIIATTWATLPPSGCVNSQGNACAKFAVPAGASGIMNANNVRSNSFEDIPTYLYSGGLIDMHSHVNISGLVYVPQAMELEAKDNNITDQTIGIQQYFSGSIVIRDGFFIEANSTENSVTVISANPQSYSTARRSTTTSTPPSFNPELGGPGTVPTDAPPGGGGGDARSPCIDCSTGSGSDSATLGPRLWMEVRPQ
ncbi:MAG: hypothetical protein ACC707_17145 [Thiohalomonadales bacterium]